MSKLNKYLFKKQQNKTIYRSKWTEMIQLASFKINTFKTMVSRLQTMWNKGNLYLRNDKSILLLILNFLSSLIIFELCSKDKLKDVFSGKHIKQEGLNQIETYK